MSNSFTKKRVYIPSETGTGNGNGGGNTSFNGNRAITRKVVGLEGVTPGGDNVVTALENLLFPAVAPSASISVNNPTREVGQSTAYTLNWSVTKNTNPITAITVDGSAVVGVTGVNQASTKSGNVATSSGNYSFGITVTDGALSSTATATIQYLMRMFWGNINKKTGITDSDILALTDNELRSNRNKAFTNFGGGGLYPIFAIPVAFGLPSFTVNGLANTDFTVVLANHPFVNQHGATVAMNVIVFNNIYNSPLNSLAIV